MYSKKIFLARQNKDGAIFESADLMNPLGCNSNQLKDIMAYCGYEYLTISDEKLFFYSNEKNQQKKLQK